MKLLLVQSRPAIRVYKLAWALRKRGHVSFVAHGVGKPLIAEHNWMANMITHIPIKNADDIETIAEHMDAIVHFNADVELASAGQSHPGYTIFVGDLATVRERMNPRKDERERQNLRAARALMYVSPGQSELAEILHGSLTAPSLVLHNGPVAEMITSSDTAPKLSDEDGLTHIVYSGTMSSTEGTTRDLRPVVEKLLATDGVVLHLVPSAGSEFPEQVRSLASSQRLVLEPTVPSLDLVPHLARCDIGLVYVNPAYPDVLRTFRPNKLYEYLAAGLPVLASNGDAVRSYLNERRAGIVFESIDDIPQLVNEVLQISCRTGWPIPVETYESQLDAIEGLFEIALGPSSRTTHAATNTQGVSRRPREEVDLARRILAGLPWASTSNADTLLLSARIASHLLALGDPRMRPLLAAQLDRLLTLARCPGGGRLGWGLPYAYDAFSDGTENPENAIYSYTTAAAALTFLDAHLATSDPRHLDSAQQAAATLLTETGWWNRDGLAGIWYSDQPNDQVPDYLVYNVCGLTLSVLGRLDRARPSERFVQERRSLSQMLVESLSSHGETKWPYHAGRDRENDLIHACFIAEGLLEGSRDARTQALRLLQVLRRRHFGTDGSPCHDRDTLGSRGWGPGAGLYALASTPETFIYAEELGPTIASRVHHDGTVEGEQREPERARAWYGLGLARWALAKRGTCPELLPPIDARTARPPFIHVSPGRHLH